ncbi:conserved hypothetical protein [Synechococcus sp. PCC 7335]|uniref:DUF924 family protein n=1 Tax=Synechococcus sp. (strain ATCC 29403 / PCC 7335) TaxID=91464 RepID=UPI00017ED63F|nr:DUF924 family protein [Synechococcus sp. PCC 7335]EDX87537.1 conserved hypothetical protein [Synechococcus sp. PCC 7335]
MVGFDGSQSRVEAILSFWFGDSTASDYGHYRKAWFIKDLTFDEQIRNQFLTDTQKAAEGVYENWKALPSSAVALILLLDQFPRNIYRGQPRSFATDAQALEVAQYLVDTGLDRNLIPAYRFFVYLPFEHSEDMNYQDHCVELMQRLIEDVPDLDKGLKGGLDYAKRHRDVIKQFGRFPHRNEILGRESTPAELAFLQQPGSRF